MTLRDRFPALPVPASVNFEDISDLGNVTFRGDVRSFAWDGGGSLAGGADADAGAGFFLDSSAGSAQFEGDLFIGGEINLLEDSGVLRIGPTGDQIILTSEPTAYRLWDLTPDVFAASAIIFDADWSSASITTDAAITVNDGQDTGVPFLLVAGPHPGTEHLDAGHLRLGVGIDGVSTFASLFAESINFQSGLTAIANMNADRIQASLPVRGTDGSTGTPTFSFANRTDWGLSADNTSGLVFSVAGVAQMTLGTALGTGLRSVAVRDTTTGAAASVFINATSGLFARSTSALKYKEQVEEIDLADIKLVPTKHWRPDDQKFRYGLIADWLADEDPLLGEYDENGEVESYDVRAVLAVMASKINRLEARSGC